MNKKNFMKILMKNYWKDHTELKLTSRYDVEEMIKSGNLNSQEIEYKNYTFCLIQNYEEIRFESDYAHQPYCIMSDIFGYVITVPTFEQLTQKDIDKAIYYILHEMTDLIFFTVLLDEKRVRDMGTPRYQEDILSIRAYNEYDKEKS